jgi:hypothetical protein
MAYNQLRMNIRNAMVPMTVSEAQDFVDSFDHVETKGYAKEFLRELEEDFAACDTMDLL